MVEVMVVEEMVVCKSSSSPYSHHDESQSVHLSLPQTTHHPSLPHLTASTGVCYPGCSEHNIN